ncbi:MAG: hypothetical protein C0498_01235 [Anaerolinea sp.]|nr:hypothetical protein [Anaerolinea sp.]
MDGAGMKSARGSDLGRWHEGESSTVECEDGCELVVSNVTYSRALRAARRHARAWRHTLTIERARFLVVYPPNDDRPR